MIAQRKFSLDERTKEALKDRLPEWLEKVTGQPVKMRGETDFEAVCPFCGTPEKRKFDGRLKGCWQGTCRVCGKGGDLFKIVQELHGVGFVDAVQMAAGAIGFPIPGFEEIPHETREQSEARQREREERQRAQAEAKAREDAQKRKEWPQFVESKARGCRTVSNLRSIPFPGVRFAHDNGILRFCNWGDGLNDPAPCWALLSHDGTCAEVRRLDGQPIQVSREKFAKAKALPGSQKKHTLLGEQWLFGNDKEPVLFGEGGPDFLVACHLAMFASSHDALPVWIPTGCLGTQFDFTPEQLQKLSGRIVRCFVDNDEAGEKAANRWADALTGAGCTVKLVRLGKLSQRLPDGSNIKDLNDALVAHSDRLEEFSRKVVEL